MSKYTITRKVPLEKYYEVYINADSNDYDYISTKEMYSQEEFDEIVEELISLKNNYSGRHQLKDYENRYDLNIPCNDYDGYCHTLIDLVVTMYDVDGYVYDVELNLNN